MDNKQKLYLLLGLVIGSYGYVFDEMIFPAMYLSIIALTTSVFFNVDNIFKMDENIKRIFLVTILIIIYRLNNIEEIYNGITFVSVMNIIIISQGLSIFNQDGYWISKTLIKINYLYVFMTLLIIIIPSQFISVNRVSVYIAITSLFLPFIYYYVLIYSNNIKVMVIKKGANYDPISSK